MSATDEALAQAVIDHFHAPDDTHSSWWLNTDELRHAFVPILAAHDREVAAKALRDAAAVLAGLSGRDRLGYRRWLKGRADQIEHLGEG